MTVPLLVALWRGLEKRMDELKRCTRECVTRSECESKYDGLAKAIGLMLKPMNEKLDKLSNGGSIDALRVQVAANAEKIAVLRSQAGTD